MIIIVGGIMFFALRGIWRWRRNKVEDNHEHMPKGKQRLLTAVQAVPIMLLAMIGFSLVTMAMGIR